MNEFHGPLPIQPKKILINNQKFAVQVSFYYLTSYQQVTKVK